MVRAYHDVMVCANQIIGWSKYGHLNMEQSRMASENVFFNVYFCIIVAKNVTPYTTFVTLIFRLIKHFQTNESSQRSSTQMVVKISS